MTITSGLRGFALACDEQTKKTLQMAADRIDAEVAKLHERIRELEMESSKAFYNEAYTNDENRRLRELARDAMKSACTGCPHKRAWRSCEGCNLYEQATKLGTEVES